MQQVCLQRPPMFPPDRRSSAQNSLKRRLNELGQLSHKLPQLPDEAFS
jgi:hypothetical protein